MKLPIHNKRQAVGKTVVAGHLAKRGKLNYRLLRLSAQRKREQQQSTEVKPALKRDSDGKIKMTVEFNKAGNLRGMHNKEHPMSPERARTIRAMRKFYNKQMPVLQCSNCAFAQSCPHMRAGYECAFTPYINAHRINNEQDLLEAMQNLVEANMHRAHLQSALETLSGGMPSVEVSESLNMAFMQLKSLHEAMQDSAAKVTLETSDTSIIGSLFGGLDNLVNNTKESQQKPIDVAPTITQETTPALLSAPKLDDVNQALLRDTLREEHLTARIKRGKQTAVPSNITVTELK